MLAQRPVCRADDELHHLDRRIPDAAVLAEPRVVGGEEVLVEVDHRVCTGAAVVAHELGDVDRAEEVGETVNYPHQFVLEITGYILKELLEKRICLGDEPQRFFAREIFRRRVVEPRGEHAVSQGLGEDVRKLLRADVRHQYFP